MDDLFFVLLGLGAFALLLGTPILALVALVRGGALRRRVEALERELALRGAAPEAAQPLAPSAPLAPSEPLAPAAPAVTSQPAVPPTPSPAPAPFYAQPAPAPARAFAPAPAPAPFVAPAPVRPPAPAAAPAPAAPAPPPRARINWEQWAGVRGAAVLGGAVLALAAILFVKLAFENQWIGPAARCWLGAAFGLVAIAGGAVLRKRAYRFLPNALDGAGVVAQFAAVWAAHTIYGFFSLAVALPLFAAVTALACWLSIRHRSQLTAVLGLLGGFTAAFLLSEQGRHPLGLFSYLLLLDLALLFVGRRSGWPLLGALALLGTFFYEGLYVLRDLDPEHLLFALAVLGVFALLFALGGGLGRTAGRGAGRAWLASQAGAVLLPFAFALHFAGRASFQGHIGAVAGLVGLLATAACVLARAQRAPWLAAGAAAAGLAVFGVWAVDAEAASTAPLTLSALAAGLALLYHAFAERDARAAAGGEALAGGRGRAAALAAAGALLLVALAPAAGGHTSDWAWVLGLAVPAAALMRQSAFAGGALLAFVAGALSGLGAMIHGIATVPALEGPFAPPPMHVLLGFLTLGAAGFLAGGALLSGRARTAAWHAVGLFLVPGLLGLVHTASKDGTDPAFLLALLAPVLLFALAAGLLGSFVWTGAGPLCLFVVILACSANHVFGGGAQPPAAVFVTLVLSALAFGAAPLAFPAGRGRRVVWMAAALALPILYPLLHAHYEERFSDKAACTPLLLAALLAAGLALLAVRRLAGTPAFRTARAAYSAAAVLFLSGALPVQLDFEVPAVWLALCALGLAALARRQDAVWLARLSSALAIVATVILVVEAVEPFHYAREGTPVFSWIGYAHLVPLAALLGAAFLLRDRRPRGEAAAAGLCAVVLGFVFVNVTILDVFSPPGSRLAFSVERLQARDLATSISWAVYALLLLGAGTALKASALRWTSLALLLLTIAKVFLFDLGELSGLNRVASLAGLAVALLAVSLLYQRFVFRRPAPAEA